jgi:DTW domain-containing protein YfiP
MTPLRVRLKSKRPGERCDHCGVHPEVCICRLSPDLDTATRVVILMHCKESRLSTSTARLARRALRRCEIRIRGQKGVPTDVSGLLEEGRRALVLFPTADARPLSVELMAEIPPPYTLVVPDGSWRQASRCVRRIKELDGLPRVKVPPGPPSEYRLRAQPSLESLCTFEAIARALGAIEGGSIQAKLEAFLRLKVDATRRSRGNPRRAIPSEPP